VSFFFHITFFFSPSSSIPKLLLAPAFKFNILSDSSRSALGVIINFFSTSIWTHEEIVIRWGKKIFHVSLNARQAGEMFRALFVFSLITIKNFFSLLFTPKLLVTLTALRSVWPADVN
jgi:hypothetical protein